jgi:hypothetical protein
LALEDAQRKLVNEFVPIRHFSNSGTPMSDPASSTRVFRGLHVAGTAHDEVEQR